jgi:hypothetical protein
MDNVQMHDPFPPQGQQSGFESFRNDIGDGEGQSTGLLVNLLRRFVGMGGTGTSAQENPDTSGSEEEI